MMEWDQILNNILFPPLNYFINGVLLCLFLVMVGIALGIILGVAITVIKWTL